jgi:hypothetical protein
LVCETSWVEMQTQKMQKITPIIGRFIFRRIKPVWVTLSRHSVNTNWRKLSNLLAPLFLRAISYQQITFFAKCKKNCVSFK